MQMFILIVLALACVCFFAYSLIKLISAIKERKGQKPKALDDNGKEEEYDRD